MKHHHYLFTLLFAITICFGGCTIEKNKITSGLRYCESVLSYGDGLLIANFGSSELNPLNTEGKGYISYYDGENVSVRIPADGLLSAPKGMALSGDWLWIADINKIVAYNLADSSAHPVVVTMPKQDIFVNHIVLVGDIMLVSVTDSGNIYAISADETGKPVADSLDIYMNIPGVNGLLFHEGTLYIATYSPEGTPSADNVIYAVNDLSAPVPEPIISRPGQYDGLALCEEFLYFTDWTVGSAGKINLTTRTVEIIPLDSPIGGPAEIDIWNGSLCIPDLVNSEVLIVKL